MGRYRVYRPKCGAAGRSIGHKGRNIGAHNYMIYESYALMVRMHPIHESDNIHDSDIRTINKIIFITRIYDS